MKKESKFKIFSQHELVRESISFDMEWIPFTGPYWHNKTRIIARFILYKHWGADCIAH